ncbi:hypothetical protein O0I10_012753 [Lichtheimia ornata]|uniref:Stress-activated map kinase-interacting protein 1 n=1 Tax=Lichtheimia ornata TaxID=688661 RepID=A0AAD7UR70_9FUNG|nr:uncharacterized protein O0I10_012753 [Lichtheimia ornata]KAJ8651685.1 hypothetical protein O0I10_012753 [Lichtheimia ornata]
MSDDYIRLAAPTYPEMQYCYSPVYDSYLAKGGTSTGTNLISSPRTKRSHYRLRKKENMQLNPPAFPKPAASDSGNEESVTDAELGAKEDKPLPPTPMRKQSAPTLCITEASKANNGHRPKFPEDASATTTTSSLHKETMIRSHARTTSSTTFSFHGTTGSENATMTSLHPSIESPIDPSPRSSLDVEGDQASFPYTQPVESRASAKSKIINVPEQQQQQQQLPLAEQQQQQSNQEQQHEEQHQEKPLSPLVISKIKLPPPVSAIAQAPTPAAPVFKLPSNIRVDPRRRRRYNRDPQPQASPQPPQPKRPTPKSALTAMIQERASAADNPFSEFSFVSGRGENNPITLCVYLPHSAHPYEPVSLVVRPDAIVDDVIGYILYDYIEKKRKPPLEEEIYDIANWVLRIAEDDGEIEEDLPALDRTRQISMVSFDQFALCRTAPNQVKQNELIRAKLGRSGPTVDVVKSNKAAGQENHLAPPQVAAPGTSANGSTFTTVDLGPIDPVPVGPSYTSQQQEADSSAVAVPIPSSKAMLTKSTMPMTPVKYFRIRLLTNEEVSATTTIPVYAEMFIGDVLELVSRKRKLDPDEYMLTIADTNVIVPNDTTVDSMNDVTELCLMKKGAGLTIPSSSHMWRSPNKKKKDEVYYTGVFNTGPPTATSGNGNNGILSQYKKYLVNRKMQMFVGRRESILAIDGDYIHIMPPEHKGMFDSVKTTSFHVSAVLSCKQSKKAPANFKIAVAKDQSHKVYDFEAMSAKESQEIVSRINLLIQVTKAG